MGRFNNHKHKICNELGVCGLIKIVQTLTIFAMQSFIARKASAVIEVNRVGTRTSVMARVARAFVNIWKLKRHFNIL